MYAMRRAGMRRHTAYIDDGPAWRLAQQGQGRLATEKCTVKDDGQGVVPVMRRNIVNFGLAPDGSVVDHHIESAPGVADLHHGGLDGLLVCDIGHAEQSLPTACGDFIDHRLTFFNRGAHIDGDCETGCRQAQSDFTANIAASAGDQRDQSRLGVGLGICLHQQFLSGLDSNRQL